MRFALILVAALSMFGCAGKKKSPAAPPTMQNQAPGGAETGAADKASDEADGGGKGGGPQKPGDPCDGGETKKK